MSNANKKTSMKMMWRVLDEEGNIVKEVVANTLTKWGMQCLNQQVFCNLSQTSMKDTSNATFNSIAGGTGLSTTTYTIGVGTGSGAFNATDVALGAKIANGSGAGQLAYGSMTYPTQVAITGNVVDVICSCPFTNNSGADITVNEVDLEFKINDTVPALRTVMFDRTLLSFTVPNGQVRTVQYLIANM